MLRRTAAFAIIKGFKFLNIFVRVSTLRFLNVNQMYAPCCSYFMFTRPREESWKSCLSNVTVDCTIKADTSQITLKEPDLKPERADPST